MTSHRRNWQHERCGCRKRPEPLRANWKHVVKYLYWQHIRCLPPGDGPCSPRLPQESTRDASRPEYEHVWARPSRHRSIRMVIRLKSNLPNPCHQPPEVWHTAPQLLRLRDVVQVTGVPASTWYRLVQMGLAPRP